MIALCYLDIGLLAPVIGSTANNDSEIGARLGVCFTFTGTFSTKASLHRILNCFTGFGGLIGMTFIVPSELSL